MIDLEERIQRYVDELTADAPVVSVDDVMYGPTARSVRYQPVRRLMVAAVIGLAVTGGAVLLASRDDPSPVGPVINAPPTTAGTPTATVSPSSVAATAPAGSGPPVQGTIPIHAKFLEYVAAAENVFGPVEIGASCDDFPDLPIGVVEQLVVAPILELPGSGECRIRGWTYRAAGGTSDLPESITRNGHYIRDAIYDEVGNVIGYVSE